MVALAAWSGLAAGLVAQAPRLLNPQRSVFAAFPTADQPYLHVFLLADSVPLVAAGTGLTAQVRFDAREETLGSWVKRRLLTFFYNWSAG